MTDNGQNEKGEKKVVLENVTVTGKISLLDLRTLTGMTQEKFAKFVEIPYTTYRRYEKDISTAGFSEISQICDRVGIGIEKIKA